MIIRKVTRTGVGTVRYCGGGYNPSLLAQSLGWGSSFTEEENFVFTNSISQSCTRTSGSAVVTYSSAPPPGGPGKALILVDMIVTGTGIPGAARPDGVRVLSHTYDAGSSTGTITLSQVATASGTSSLTFHNSATNGEFVYHDLPVASYGSTPQGFYEYIRTNGAAGNMLIADYQISQLPAVRAAIAGSWSSYATIVLTDGACPSNISDKVLTNCTTLILNNNPLLTSLPALPNVSVMALILCNVKTLPATPSITKLRSHNNLISEYTAGQETAKLAWTDYPAA